MKLVTRAIVMLVITCMAMGAQPLVAQSVMDPNDPLVTYDSTRPLTYPQWNQIGKWVRTPRMQWNTNLWKAYYYNGYAFRLKFPKTYVPNVNDGKKYPMLIFFHGFGEVARPTDNEFHMLLGHQFFEWHVESGNYDGYVLSMQSQTYFGPNHYQALMEIVQYMIANNKLDQFAVTANGLSMGAQASWEIANTYPSQIAGAIPMSAASTGYTDPAMINRLKFTPIWHTQGGRDPNPTPNTAYILEDAYYGAGANYRLSFYPNNDHDTWNSAWAEQDFFPFLKRAYMSNPWPLYGRTEFFTGEPISATIGVPPGFDGYEWRRNGAAYLGTGNSITVTQPGIYTARVLKGSVWSEWSRIPVEIKVKPIPSLPYRVEAESWHRMRGVQNEWTADGGGGGNVGYVDRGDWMEYSFYPPTTGTYTLNVRVASNMNNGQMQFKKADGTVLATVNVPNTGGWQVWQTVSTTINLTQGGQVLRLQSTADSSWNVNWFEITQGGTPGNQAPTVNAGADQNITLPTSTASLTGTASDPDGSISTYLWTKISGPAGGSITSPSTANTTVTGLAEGTYVFRLTATDNGGATASDDVQINVQQAAPPPPSGTSRIEAENYSAMSGVVKETTTDAGGGQNVGYIDQNDWMDYSINMSSAGTYTINLRIASAMAGSQVQVRNAAGTVLATIAIPNTGGWQTWQTISSTLTLPAGVQTIRLQSSASGNWNINWFELIPGGTTPVNAAPTANAGADQTVTLPASSTTLNGSGTDTDGSIASYLWTKVSGPAGGTIASPASPSTSVTGLTQGTYTFRLTVTDNGGATGTDDVIVTVAQSNPGGSTRIEAENYTSMSGIQTETTSDAGGGLNVGYIDLNDWMNYSVNVATAGAYTVNLRIASQMTGGQVQIRNAAGSVLATVNIPNTGGWQTWQTVSAAINLSAGTQTLRLQSSASAGWNINWFELVPGSSTPPPPVPTRVEAENYTTMNGVQRENTADIGGGQNVGYIDNGDWMNYSITAPAAATYTFSFRVASAMTGGQFQVRNAAGTVLATVTVPNTGGWQAWQTVTASVTLPAGTQTIRLASVSAASWNINWFEFVQQGTARIAGTLMSVNGGNSTKVALDVYPNPVTDRLRLQVSHPAEGMVTIQVVNMTGRVQKTFSFNRNRGQSQHEVYLGDLPRGIYFIRVQASDWTETRKINKQ